MTRSFNGTMFKFQRKPFNSARYSVMLWTMFSLRRFAKGEYSMTPGRDIVVH